MRATLIIFTLIAGIVVACASDADAPLKTSPGAGSTADDVTSPAAESTADEVTSPATSQAPATSAPNITPEASGEIEATGIVGAVDEGNGVIEIRPTGSGTITRVEVAAGARIRLATGGTLSLAEIRSSDRLSATGVAGEAPDTIVADSIEISRVVPGAAPGG